MTDERIAAIEAEHVKHDDGLPGDPCCVCCYDRWPCDAVIVLTRLREVEQERDAAQEQANRLAQSGERAMTAALDRMRIGAKRLDACREHEVELEAERDAALADSQRLAEALRPFAVFDADYPRTQDQRLARASAALAAHDGPPPDMEAVARQDIIDGIRANDEATR